MLILKLQRLSSAPAVPITMVGLDVTRRAVLREEHIRALEKADNPISHAAGLIMRATMNRITKRQSTWRARDARFFGCSNFSRSIDRHTAGLLHRDRNRRRIHGRRNRGLTTVLRCVARRLGQQHPYGSCVSARSTQIARWPWMLTRSVSTTS